MIEREQDGIRWLEFTLLADCPKIRHAVFMRQGGHSNGDFGSLNFSYSVGDRNEHVDANYATAKSILNWDRLVRGKLEHGSRVLAINSSTEALIGPCDALATQIPGQALCMTHADCQAAILYDPVKHAVVNIHSGWRGNVKNIYSEAVAFMKKHYYSSPTDILACISPSLGPEHAEFVNYKTEFPEPFWDFQIRENYFNLWEIARWQLSEAGISKHHIEIAEICTFANPDNWFSYRRTPVSGRHGTFALLAQ
ncbi:MAG: laccase domain-containing protein [Chlamydiales bacterium]|nr:laccase domain-containing protein [Chlamydiia bacterium]MCP5507522.1 laccase domain-containing protein [Chlamydiales bacterium]